MKHIVAAIFLLFSITTFADDLDQAVRRLQEATRKLNAKMAAEEAARTERLNRDWDEVANGRSQTTPTTTLPKLPNLAKPVYITPGTLVCTNESSLTGAITTGRPEEWIRRDYCLISKKKVRVVVYPTEEDADCPTTRRLGCHCTTLLCGRIVMVAARSNEMSDGR